MKRQLITLVLIGGILYPAGRAMVHGSKKAAHATVHATKAVAKGTVKLVK